MNQLTCVIVDDEDRGRQYLADLLAEYCPHVQLVGMASSVEAAVETILTSEPSLVLLDIKMPRGSGFDVLDRVKSVKFEVIFTTAHDEYAVQAFKVSAVDYLLKPIDPKELKVAITKVNRYNRQEQEWVSRFDVLLNELAGNQNRKISFPTLDGIVLLNPEDITHFEADGAYTILHKHNKEHMLISSNIGDIEQRLTNKGFYRTHNSFMVNLAHVSQYFKGSPGYIRLSGHADVTLSRRRRDGFLKLLNR